MKNINSLSLKMIEALDRAIQKHEDDYNHPKI